MRSPGENHQVGRGQVLDVIGPNAKLDIAYRQFHPDGVSYEHRQRRHEQQIHCKVSDR
jgi:hypothetical protein